MKRIMQTNLTSQTIKDLKYFEGKVCTIFMPSINRQFEEHQSREYFTIVVELINVDGIWGSHPYQKTKSFFLWSSILSINEEVVLDPNNPDHQKVIEEYEKKNNKKATSDLNPSLLSSSHSPNESEPPKDAFFIDINKLNKLAEDTKKVYSSSSP